MPVNERFYSSGNRFLSKSIFRTCLREDFLSIVVFPINSMTYSSLDIATCILITLQKSLCNSYFQFEV
ncbi:hypothetical protein B5G16_12200 [Alistipes sp. An66]|nr:hypothetical protein B5G16_12200 [Alistipes sp. An66]